MICTACGAQALTFQDGGLFCTVCNRVVSSGFVDGYTRAPDASTNGNGLEVYYGGKIIRAYYSQGSASWYAVVEASIGAELVGCRYWRCNPAVQPAHVTTTALEDRMRKLGFNFEFTRRAHATGAPRRMQSTPARWISEQDKQRAATADGWWEVEAWSALEHTAYVIVAAATLEAAVDYLERTLQPPI